MIVEGGCYCGAVRYRAEGDPALKGQCHCRECQYFSGGSANVLIGMPGAGFQYTKGAPKQFTRSGIENPVTRDFCATCGTQLVSHAPILAGVALIKVGTFDQPAEFGMPQMAIFTCDQQPFHEIPQGVPTFERLPF
jgi:hypothetical protein